MKLSDITTIPELAEFMSKPVLYTDHYGFVTLHPGDLEAVLELGGNPRIQLRYRYQDNHAPVSGEVYDNADELRLAMVLKEKRYAEECLERYRCDIEETRKRLLELDESAEKYRQALAKESEI